MEIDETEERMVPRNYGELLELMVDDLKGEIEIETIRAQADVIAMHFKITVRELQTESGAEFHFSDNSVGSFARS